MDGYPYISELYNRGTKIDSVYAWSTHEDKIYTSSIPLTKYEWALVLPVYEFPVEIKTT